MKKQKNPEERYIFALTYDEVETIYNALFHMNYDEELEARFYKAYLELKERKKKGL